jgi:predicted ATPase/DNA-binding XRE family transcriptional regulator
MNGAGAFGQTLRLHRHTRRWTQVELAERAGLSERAISDLERGLKHPQPATVGMLIEALGLAPDIAESLEVAARSHRVTPEQMVDGPVHHNLPVALTSFIGRRKDITRLQGLLERADSANFGARLVTLTGSGGCGKTRLAIELAGRMLAEFPEGVWFADLSSTMDPALVLNVVLAAIGGQAASDQAPLESLLRRVRGQTLLLVLDNCEHLVDACANLVSRLLAASPYLRVLATSREALGVDGEIVWRVPPLSFPEFGWVMQSQHLLEYESVQLLVDRVQQAEPEFSLTGENASALASICTRMDGIPLALELAAARAGAMSLTEINARLDDCFALLSGGRRTANPRQRTLRAAIQWSHDLLSPAERILFRRLAVFSGGWALEAAEAVCEGRA